MRPPTPEDHPGLSYHAIPARFANHPLVEGRPFYTLPSSLLDSLVKEVGSERFDRQLLQLETDLAENCGAGGIGFWLDRRLVFPLLGYRPIEIDSITSDNFDWNEEQFAAVNSIGRSRAEKLASIARGYAGWLLTNHQFLAEHDAILRSWHADIIANGIPVMGPVVSNAKSIPGAVTRPKAHTAQLLTAFEEFFVRWRLQGMVAPNLPQPLFPQLPVAHLPSVLGHMRGGGETFYMPDTFPVPTRDELREILEDALRGSGSPEHMAEWTKIVRGTNSAKSAISHYARLFELQHYVRLIYQRHAGALAKGKGRVKQALATFFEMSPEAIEKDLALIAERLGEEWYLAPPFGPSKNP